MISKRSSVNLMIVVVMGLVIVVMTFFPVGTAIARGLGIIQPEQSTASIRKIVDTAQKLPANQGENIEITMDEDTAIMGFSSGPQGLHLSRDWGLDLEFRRPTECGNGPCICLCKKIDHDTAYGSEAYFCRIPKVGETEKYIECFKDFGGKTDIVSSISKEVFAGDSELVDYDTKGGFFFGRASVGDGLIKSKVFGLEERFIVRVERSKGFHVGVCLNQKGCITEEMELDEGYRSNALLMFQQAERTDATTETGLRERIRLFGEIAADPELMAALKKDDDEKVDMVYFYQAIALYRLFDEHNIGVPEEILKTMKTLTSNIKRDGYTDRLKKDMAKLECDKIKKDCSCYNDWWETPDEEACHNSDMNCYYTNNAWVYICESCSKVNACNDYKRRECEKNPCKVSGGCRYDDSSFKCVTK